MPRELGESVVVGVDMVVRIVVVVGTAAAPAAAAARAVDGCYSSGRPW